MAYENLKYLGSNSMVSMREHPTCSELQYEGVHYLHLPEIDNNTPPASDVLIRGADFVASEIKASGKVYIHAARAWDAGLPCAWLT